MYFQVKPLTQFLADISGDVVALLSSMLVMLYTEIVTGNKKFRVCKFQILALCVNCYGNLVSVNTSRLQFCFQSSIFIRSEQG